MLPFLKKKQDASVSAPIESIRMSDQEESDMDPIEVCAEELCHAIEKKDHKAIAEAIRSIFEILDSEPHEEGPHINEER